MTIKIIPQEQLEKKDEHSSIIHNVPLLFYPTPSLTYSKRIKRMLLLAKESAFSDYLYFCAKIVTVQSELLKTHPIIQNLNELVKQGATQNIPPLSIQNMPLSTKWLEYLYPILEATQAINDEITNTVKILEANSQNELLNKAIALINGQFDLVSNNESVFIWSALSLYYTQLASQLPGKAVAQVGEKRWLCPVCQSSPTSSIVHIGNNIGLRYLHCSLCESEWYVPRSKCTNCDNLENITYYSLDQELSAIKTECCDACHGYLKVFNQDRDPYVDVLADDINSLILDMETENLGFAKSGINPLLLPS